MNLGDMDHVIHPLDKVVLLTARSFSKARTNRDAYRVYLASANKKWEEYGECGKTANGWVTPSSKEIPCGRRDCSGIWEGEVDDEEYFLDEITNLMNPIVSVQSNWEFKPEDELLNYDENQSAEDFWGEDQGAGCSGPDFSLNAERELWFKRQVVIFVLADTEVFTEQARQQRTVSAGPRRQQTEDWRQPGALVDNHPTVSRFLQGPDRQFLYFNFEDLGHSQNWARKHRNDRGCFMQITTGVDENNWAYADIQKVKSK